MWPALAAVGLVILGTCCWDHLVARRRYRAQRTLSNDIWAATLAAQEQERRRSA